MRDEPYNLSSEVSSELQRAVCPKCPSCGCRHILAAPVVIDSVGATQVLTCHECWTQWRVNYGIRQTHEKQT